MKLLIRPSSIQPWRPECARHDRTHSSIAGTYRPLAYLRQSISAERGDALGFTRFLHDRSGATAIEYALLAALMAIVAIGGLRAMAGGAGGLYATLETIAAAIQTALTR